MPFDVSVHHTDYWLNVFATLYSLFPNSSIIVVGIYGLITRKIWYLMLALYGIGVAAIIQIIAAAVGQDRPAASCCPPGDKGMPSGHGAHYGTFITWISWEILTNPRLNHCLWWQRGLLLFIPLLLWAPGFPSRVYVHDHTWQQITAGGILGFFFAILWILFLHYWFRPKGLYKLMNSKFAKKIGLKNDYYPMEVAERALSPRLIDNNAQGVGGHPKTGWGGSNPTNGYNPAEPEGTEMVTTV